MTQDAKDSIKSAVLVVWFILSVFAVVLIVGLLGERENLELALATEKQVVAAQDTLNEALAERITQLEGTILDQSAHIEILAAINPLRHLLSPQDINYLTSELVPSSPFNSTVHFTAGFGESVGYGGRWRERHGGQDMIPEGSPVVRALWEGRSVDIGIDEIYGYYVILEHTPWLRSKYAHLDMIYFEAEVGLESEQGAPIGIMGNTGLSDGAHLHLEVQIFDGDVWRNVDPKPWILKEGI